ncbi:MAG: PAS domain S-box protein, partial [Salinibacter sp.]
KGGNVLHYDGVVIDITDRKEAEEQLRRREEQLRRINENISDGIYRSAPGEGLVYANQAFAEMFGYGRVEEVLDADPTTLYADPEQREQLRATLHDEGHFESVEVEFRRKDGSTFTGLLSGTVARGEDGEVKYYDGAVTDVSDRVRRERKLRLLSEAVDQAKEAVLITEAEPLEEPGPRIVYVNEAFEEMTGYPEDEVLGETPRILQGPETDRDVLDSLQEALEAGEEWQGETVNYRKDGEPLRVQWNVAPVRNGNGEIEHWVSVQRDVTAEREREQWMTQMAQALEQIDEKVFITGRDGRIQYANEAFEEMTGYHEEEVLGKTPAVVQSGEHDEAFYEELWDTILSGETFRAEFVNEKKDGTRYVEEECISPIVDEDGEVTHFVSSGRDISERKRRKRTLERQNDLFEQAEEIANVGAWEYDVQAEEITLTDQAYRVHGLAPGSDMTPDRSHGLFHPEDRPKADEAFRRAVEEGEPYDLEARLITEEGEERWIRTRGAPQCEDGEVVRVCGAIQDITDRKEAEQALKASEELHRATLSNITDTVLLTREDGTFSYVCPNVSYIFGYDEEEVEELGSISALLGTDPAEEHDFEGAREISNVEQSVIDASGNRHDLLINVRQVEIQDGRRMYTCRDITERKQAEEALREREVQLRGLANSIPGVVYQFYSRPDGTYGNHFI